ncbi:MAG TPA: hypothetical protein VMT68_19980 [Caulobacteraceae bacterium]|nr:hypothetical protein [Caulobacteraceae bacterium]
MTLLQLANVGSFVGSLVGVASLIYVALQQRLSARAMRGQAAVAVYQHYRESAAMRADPRFTEALRRCGFGLADVSADDLAQFSAVVGATLRGFEMETFLNRQGLLDACAFARRARYYQQFLAMPGVRAQWRLSAANFSPEFAKLVDDLMAETPVASANALDWFQTTWRRAVDEELRATLGAS